MTSSISPTALVYSDLFLKHIPTTRMVETKHRCTAIIKAISDLSLLRIPPQPAQIEDLLRCHTAEHLNQLKTEAEQSPKYGLARLTTTVLQNPKFNLYLTTYC